jgi:hypothetical protein
MVITQSGTVGAHGRGQPLHTVAVEDLRFPGRGLGQGTGWHGERTMSSLASA